jgi:hypothetical protein
VAPRGVIEVDRTGLPVVVQDVLQAQVGVDQPVTRWALAKAGEHGFDPSGRPGPLSVTQVAGVARGVPIAAFVIMTGMRS